MNSYRRPHENRLMSWRRRSRGEMGGVMVEALWRSGGVGVFVAMYIWLCKATAVANSWWCLWGFTTRFRVWPYFIAFARAAGTPSLLFFVPVLLVVLVLMLPTLRLIHVPSLLFMRSRQSKFSSHHGPRSKAVPRFRTHHSQRQIPRTLNTKQI